MKIVILDLIPCECCGVGKLPEDMKIDENGVWTCLGCIDEFKNQTYKTLIEVDKVALMVKDTLEEMMTGFDSINERDDFIMDIVLGVKKRIQNEN